MMNLGFTGFVPVFCSLLLLPLLILFSPIAVSEVVRAGQSGNDLLFYNGVSICSRRPLAGTW